MIHERNEKFNKDTGTKQFLELNNTMTELKISIESFNNNFNQAEERIIELIDKLLEIIQSGDQKEERMKKSKESLWELWNTSIRLRPVPS